MTTKYADPKNVYYTTYLNLELNEDGTLQNHSPTLGYEAAVAKATLEAAKDSDYDPVYILKLVGKVQNAPPTLPVTTF